jgi:hypothetical protein
MCFWDKFRYCDLWKWKWEYLNLMQTKLNNTFKDHMSFLSLISWVIEVLFRK